MKKVAVGIIAAIALYAVVVGSKTEDRRPWPVEALRPLSLGICGMEDNQ